MLKAVYNSTALKGRAQFASHSGLKSVGSQSRFELYMKGVKHEGRKTHASEYRDQSYSGPYSGRRGQHLKKRVDS